MVAPSSGPGLSCSSPAGSVLLVQLPIRAVLAFMAHIGGFITGYGLAFILLGNRVAQAVPDQPQGFPGSRKKQLVMMAVRQD